MPNIKLMESGLPVAPLKIGALESCRELGEKVNDYIVQFRKSTMDKNTDSPLYYNYLRDNYLIDCPCPRFGSGRSKRTSYRIYPRNRSVPYGRCL